MEVLMNDYTTSNSWDVRCTLTSIFLSFSSASWTAAGQKEGTVDHPGITLPEHSQTEIQITFSAIFP